MGKPWKELEKKTAAALGGVRIDRSDDYGRSDYDVLVPDFQFLRVDAKFRKRHAHHAFVEEIRTKYCQDGRSYPVLVTKHHSGRRVYVTVDLALFASMLDLLRKVSKDDLDGLKREEEASGQGVRQDASGTGGAEEKPPET